MLETDALDSVIAGVYSQKQTDGEWHPITYSIAFSFTPFFIISASIGISCHL